MTYQKADYPLDYSTSAKAPAKDRVEGMVESANDRLGAITEKAEEMIDSFGDQARAYSDKAQEAAKNFKPYVEKSLREQPIATLVVAAGLAFALGALWKKQS